LQFIGASPERHGIRRIVAQPYGRNAASPERKAFPETLDELHREIVLVRRRSARDGFRDDDFEPTLCAEPAGGVRCLVPSSLRDRAIGVRRAMIPPARSAASAADGCPSQPHLHMARNIMTGALALGHQHGADAEAVGRFTAVTFAVQSVLTLLSYGIDQATYPLAVKAVEPTDRALCTTS
jgi:hypothetical protein